MAATYSGCAFKLHLPECLEYDDHVKISYKFEYRKGNTEKIVFYKAVLTDRVNVTHEDEGLKRYFDNTRIMAQRASLNIWKGTEKIWMRKAQLLMSFLSNNGEKTNVLFRFDTPTKGTLLDVYKEPMTSSEKEVYAKIILEATNPESQQETSSHAGANGNAGDNYGSAGKGSSIPTEDLPGLERYCDALKTEKLFLMHEGGRKYKVTNGKLISSVKGIYSYVFDLETELHISDDAPIKISVGGGFAQTNGSVLMCEDFQIIVQLELNIGDRVGSAVISVEPWKLLEALEERLKYGIGIHSSKIAAKILKDGPQLATRRSIDQIPKGQNAVIEKALTEPVCIVWGPPGTGKTHTMSELAIRFLNAGKTVLIVSHSNVSVDGVAKKIDELLRQKGQEASLRAGKILRYGYVRDEELNKNKYVSSFYYAVTKNPSLNKQLDALQAEYDQLKHTKGIGSPRIIEIRKEISKIRSQIREQECCYVSDASIVATTISKVVIDKLFQEKKYDVVMFDEVSMAYVLQVVCAATFAKEHIICVGDFMQLAPIAQSKAQEILCEDIFTYLGINRYGKPYFHPWLVMLDEQRRMHPKISAFANQYVYNRMLKDHPSTQSSRNEIVAAKPFENQAINLIDLTGCYCAASKNADNSRFNVLSAFISFAAAVKTEPNVQNVSIITPYAAQTRLIRALELDYRQHGNTEIRCATVHQFQGSESDVIFFDAVESYPAKKPGWLMGKDFNSIQRLINVAVTRAKGKLITVANSRFWNNNYAGTQHTFYKLVSYLTDEGNLIRHLEDRSLEELIESLTIKGGPEFFLKAEKYMPLLEKDFKSAKGKIVISLPCGELAPDYQETICDWVEKAKMQGIQVLIKTNEYADLPEKWKKYTWGTDNATFPIIMIDDHITWYGVPQAPWTFRDGNTGYRTVCNIVCRVKGEHTAEMIRSLADLEYRESNGGKSPLLPRPEASGPDPEGPAGLASYVAKNMKCPFCKQALMLSRGKSGKTILWCKVCKKTQLLSPDDVNHYMRINHVRCPQHKCEMVAGVGKFGLYIRCNAGHYVKPEEI
ncbi:MAG: AAA domain-containing protein [Dorea sp.]